MSEDMQVEGIKAQLFAFKLPSSNNFWAIAKKDKGGGNLARPPRPNRVKQKYSFFPYN